MAKYSKFLVADGDVKNYNNWKVFLGDKINIINFKDLPIKGVVTEFHLDSIVVLDDNENLEFLIFLQDIKDVEIIERAV